METELFPHHLTNKLSLKEAVLFRKLRNDQKLNCRSDLSANDPPTGVPIDSKESSEEKPVEIRTKLMKNRHELDELLHNGPDFLKSKKEPNQYPHNNDHVNSEVSALPMKFYQQVPKNVDEESTSDEEMKEPADDSPLNLSDDDSTLQTQTLVSNDESDSLKTNNQTSIEILKSEVIINTKSSRSSSFQDKQTAVTSSSSLYYEIAKPKPPPRLRKSNVNNHHFHQQLDPKSAKAILRNFAERSSSTASSNGSLQSNEEKQTEKSSNRSDSFTTCDVKKTINISQTENLEYLTCSRSSDQPRSRVLSNVLSKSDSASNITTSSGYFSPRSPSVSLSSSHSNASSITSSKFSSARSSKRSHSSFKSASGRSSVAESELKKAMTKCNEASEQESNPDEDEDVFSVKSWVETSEYANLANHNDDKTEEETKKEFTDNAIPVQQDSFKQPSKPVPSKKPVSRKPAVVNFISMIEQPHTAELKVKNRLLPNNVKLRIPGNRSKKNDASRNSRAFALQLKQLSEDSSSSPVTEAPSPNDSASRIRRNISATTTSPLKAIPLQDIANLKSDLSGSLTHLHQKNIKPATTTSEKLYNTVSGATGRHLSEKSTFFQDEHNFSSNSRVSQHEYNQYRGSMWSLNPSTNNEEASPARRRKTSISNRLKGAFSFQNIRKAISMERLNEEERVRSLSHSYLNEFGEDISQTLRPRAHTSSTDPRSPPTGRLYKAPSISSIFTTVRMRKRKSRERRAAKLRHTIAVDSKHITEYECTSDEKFPNKLNSSKEVGSPGHFRSIGRVLDVNVKENSLLVEMDKPTSGPFGFYIARRKENGNVYVTSMNDSYPDKMYAGLMKLGDEITEVNGFNVNQLTLDQIYDIISENKRLVLRIKPSQIHVV